MGQLFHSRRELPGFQRKGILCGALGKWYILPSGTITAQVVPESWGDSSGISLGYSYQIYFRHKRKGWYVNNNIFACAQERNLSLRNSNSSGKGNKYFDSGFWFGLVSEESHLEWIASANSVFDVFCIVFAINSLMVHTARLSKSSDCCSSHFSHSI